MKTIVTVKLGIGEANMNDETVMLKSSCFLAGVIAQLQNPLTKEEEEFLVSWRRIQESIPGEKPPCLTCPDIVAAHCIESETICEDFLDFQEKEAGIYNADIEAQDADTVYT